MTVPWVSCVSGRVRLYLHIRNASIMLSVAIKFETSKPRWNSAHPTRLNSRGASKKSGENSWKSADNSWLKASSIWNWNLNNFKLYKCTYIIYMKQLPYHHEFWSDDSKKDYFWYTMLFSNICTYSIFINIRLISWTSFLWMVSFLFQ